jgi:hypothetical protein
MHAIRISLLVLRAPYQEHVTVHSVASLRPFLDFERPPSQRQCNSTREIRTFYPWYSKFGECRHYYLFPQQAAMVRHAVTTYGSSSRLMLFTDVDEFAYVRDDVALLKSAKVRTFAGLLVRATLSTNVGGVRMLRDIMLPNRSRWTSKAPANDEGIFVVRDSSRQLRPPRSSAERKRTMQSMPEKNAAKPGAMPIKPDGNIHVPFGTSTHPHAHPPPYT